MFGEYIELSPENSLDIPFENLLPFLEWLEKNGFILTTEGDTESILAKPVAFNYYYDDETESVVAHFCLHKTEYA
jgi:hypothetical protein